jgi:CheY-like chemotaxis protein
MNEAAILCLDDEPVGLAVRAALLRFAGYTVFPVSSAEEALQILAEHPIDLVISDYLLKNTTGTQVAALMKQKRPHTPILILSGLVDHPGGLESADLFLSKVEPPPVLLATIAELLQPEAVMCEAAVTGDTTHRRAG